jgi:F0F1-type ATP synthase membrane subunit a
MKKPVFWNSIGIYLLLYNNILLIVSLIMALKAVVEGNGTFSGDVWYQMLIFLVYIIVIAGLLTGGKKGYILSCLFIPFIILQYFYPPIMVSLLPRMVMLAFRVIELVSFIYLILSPDSRAYIRTVDQKNE